MPGPNDLNLDSSDAIGGVGNGQATGTGQISDSFDLNAAMDDIGSDLGFKTEPDDKSATVPGIKSAEELVPPAADEAKPPEQAAPKEGDKPEESTVPAAVVAPKTWKPEAAALWAQVPPQVQTEIARREEDMFRGLEQYKGAANFGTRVNDELKPYHEILSAGNVEPVSLIKDLLSIQFQLATGTSQKKAEVIRYLANTYKVDLGQTQGSEGNEDPYEDPQIAELREQIHTLQSGQARVEQERLQTIRAQAASSVAAFFADPVNVYADEVADEIASLCRNDKSLTLAQAYEKAVWLNPTTRAKEIARQAAEKQTKAQSEAGALAAAALKAKSNNVQVQPKAGAATLPLGTMDDTMAETMRAIKNRS